MNPKDLTVDQVRSELESLIVRYPDRHGSVKVGYNWKGEADFSCVYYTDTDDMPISYVNYDPDGDPDPVFKTPVCIVGQWIEDYHCEFKEDTVIKGVLTANRTIGTMLPGEIPFDMEVWALLAKAQSAQDGSMVQWKDIDLDTLVD